MICEACTMDMMDVQALGKMICPKCQSDVFEEAALIGRALDDNDGERLLEALFERLVKNGGTVAMSLERLEGARSLFWQLRLGLDTYRECGGSHG